MDGWMDGWVGGWVSRVKDCLQQSKINKIKSMNYKIIPSRVKSCLFGCYLNNINSYIMNYFK
jgi:hypothetical protein